MIAKKATTILESCTLAALLICINLKNSVKISTLLFSESRAECRNQVRHPVLFDLKYGKLSVASSMNASQQNRG